MTHSRTTNLERVMLLAWFVLNLVIGALTVHEYGMSVDEPNNQRYAVDTLNAYPSFFGTRYEPKYDSSYDGHGPAFMVLATLFVRTVQGLLPNAFTPDLWHFAYFITLQLAGLCMYWLAKRWFSTWTAWAILVIFSTQPLLRGHAFINPKDTPFMFFLMLSVALGLHMVDGMTGKEASVSLKHLTDRFQEVDARPRKRFQTYLVLFLAVVILLAVFSGPLIEQVINFFYTSDSGTWAARLFDSVANRASDVSVQDYVTKAVRLFHRVEFALLIAGILFFLIYFGLLVGHTTLRDWLRNTWKQRHRLGTFLTNIRKSLSISWDWSSAKIWFADLFRALINPRVLLAGLALGLATAVRAIAPVAGLIVFLAMLAKVRSRAWTTTIAYFLVAGVMTYIAWPRLWGAPIRRYLEGLGVISSFPHFPGRVLFKGELYGAEDLPASYLPVLLNIQLTEPLLLCMYIGFCLLIWQMLHRRIRTDLLLYIGLGFAFPLFGMILLNPTLYNNFRQALFILPPMVMLGAFALEWVFEKISQSWVRVIIIAALALPGVYATIRLYPYEYVYYNSLVGGPAGATHHYELDYWRISLREMALEMNKIAPSGSLIVVTRSAGLFARYARPDLVVDKPIDSISDLEKGYDYLIQVTRGGGELYSEVQDLIVIERQGAVLATAKNVRDVTRQQTLDSDSQ
ncbi:MAG TPA: hypothetical protein VK897_00735 [Anaerolineales bacterium]|nr:hypothetical protein [Anaerolineales bacterium]